MPVKLDEEIKMLSIYNLQNIREVEYSFSILYLFIYSKKRYIKKFLYRKEFIIMSNLYEANRDLFFEYVSGEDLIYTEGANIKQLKAFNNFKKNFKPTLNKIKADIKAKKKAEAQENCKKCRKMLADVKSEIRSLDETSGVASAVFANIGNTLVTAAKILPFALLNRALQKKAWDQVDTKYPDPDFDDFGDDDDYYDEGVKERSKKTADKALGKAFDVQNSFRGQKAIADAICWGAALKANKTMGKVQRSVGQGRAEGRGAKARDFNTLRNNIIEKITKFERALSKLERKIAKMK